MVNFTPSIQGTLIANLVIRTLVKIYYIIFFSKDRFWIKIILNLVTEYSLLKLILSFKWKAAKKIQIIQLDETSFLLKST